MCDNNAQCSSGASCVQGQCLDASSLHLALSNALIIIPILIPLLFIGLFIGLMVGCIYTARRRALRLQKETESQANVQAQAQRQAMEALQNQQYQHPDIPSFQNTQLQSNIESHGQVQQQQYQPQLYQPVPAMGNGMQPNQQYFQAQQQLYSGMPQAQEYVMNAAVAPPPEQLEGQPIIQPVVGENPSKGGPDV